MVEESLSSVQTVQGINFSPESSSESRLPTTTIDTTQGWTFLAVEFYLASLTLLS